VPGTPRARLAASRSWPACRLGEDLDGRRKSREGCRGWSEVIRRSTTGAKRECDGATRGTVKRKSRTNPSDGSGRADGSGWGVNERRSELDNWECSKLRWTDGYKHNPGARTGTANGAQCSEKNSWRKRSLTRVRFPGYPRCAATRMSGNGTDKPACAVPIWKCWRRTVCGVEQLERQPRNDRRWSGSRARGGSGLQYAMMVVRRDLCVRCLKGKPCNESVCQRVGRVGGQTKRSSQTA
jgi:hypothetical protein